jgi:hypothetical protein
MMGSSVLVQGDEGLTSSTLPLRGKHYKFKSLDLISLNKKIEFDDGSD